jgi:2,3-dihydroxy-p-cumate/2,3-dihydroxybenzoate 3,4-dioxygenase
MDAPFRYRKLGYVALNVTDVARTAAFYTDVVGLDLVDTSDGTAWLRCGPDHHNVLLYPGAEPGLKRVGFELANGEELEKAKAHVERLGLAVSEAETPHQADGFRFIEPNSGMTLEYYSAMEQPPRAFRQSLTKIERLGHVVLAVENYDATIDYLTENLCFRISDFVEGRFAFLRCHPNPLHHSFAIGKSPGGNRLHHVNFMVSDIDDIGIAVNRLKRRNVEIVFGPGRHLPSGSIFLYFLDPDGLTVEFSFGMEEFPETGARAPRRIEPTPQALDIWGSVPTPGFGKIGAIETVRQVR